MPESARSFEPVPGTLWRQKASKFPITADGAAFQVAPRRVEGLYGLRGQIAFAAVTANRRQDVEGDSIVAAADQLLDQPILQIC